MALILDEHARAAIARRRARGRDSTLFLRVEYLPGRQFVIQRWEVPHPDAPDGIAIIGWDSGRGSLLQHYFDSRGVARLYEMSFGDGVWKLSRTEADFSPLDFAQRYTGAISDDGRAIRGAWELSTDGSQWEHDFDLSYSKIS